MENSIQWLAGFFDGEGCLYIRESYRPSVKAKSRRSVLSDAEYAKRKDVKDKLQVLKRVEYPAA